MSTFVKEKSAIKILKMAAADAASKNTKLELSFSGGKDSEVLRSLAILADIPFDIIYKDTTIDRPFTKRYCLDRGVKILRPSTTFFEQVLYKGLPTMFRRWCCSKFKEYYTSPVVALGVRASESVKRSKRYTEPNECRIFSKKLHVSQWFPIYDWSLIDVIEFVRYYNIQLHPYYYLPDGNIDFTRRLGCIGCPLKSDRGLKDFQEFPNFFLRLYKQLCIYFETHPNVAVVQKYFKSPSEQLFFHLFCRTYDEFLYRTGGFFPLDVHEVLQNKIGIQLPPYNSIINKHF